MPRVMTTRDGGVTVDVTLSGDTVTAIAVGNTSADPVYVTVLSGTTTILAGVAIAPGGSSTTSIKKSQQFAWTTNADWTIGVSR